MLHYIRDEPTEKVPIWRMISAPLDKLRARALNWQHSAGLLGRRSSRSRAAIGGGSLPGETVESVALRLDCAALGKSAESVLTRLRESSEPIIGRIEDNDVLLDVRTVLPSQDSAVMSEIGRLKSLV